MNRRDLKKLAALRLEEARVLLRNRKYEGCYYLAGYAVECGLKACIAKLTDRYDFPDKRTADAVYTHDLVILLREAKLVSARDEESNRDSLFRQNWLIVKEWKEISRYDVRSKQQALDLFHAIADRKHGVFRWIKQRW